MHGAVHVYLSTRVCYTSIYNISREHNFLMLENAIILTLFFHLQRLKNHTLQNKKGVYKHIASLHRLK
jgi:hypothetical protein